MNTSVIVVVNWEKSTRERYKRNIEGRSVSWYVCEEERGEGRAR